MFKNYFNKVKKMIDQIKAKLKTNEVKNLIEANKKNLTTGFIVIFTICFFAFDLGSLLSKVFTNIMNYFSNVDGEIKQIVIKSEGYDNAEGGSFQVTKEVDWISGTTAKMTYEIETIAETNGIPKDVVFVLDTSVSMEGTRLERMKREVNDVIKALLTNEENKIGIITFNTTSTILTGLTNEEDMLTTIIEGIKVEGDTNYYQALVNVDKMLEGYQKKANRELVVLFITDGYPNVETPNQVAKYEMIKKKYPYIKIYGISYEAGEGVVEELKKISEEQFTSEEETNVLMEATFTPEYYDKYELSEYVDNEYFYVDNEEDIKVSIGRVEITQYEGVQKITWTAGEEEFRTGSKATIEINLNLNESLNRVEGLYPTSTGTNIISKLYGQEKKEIINEETTILKNGYKVKYEANAPKECNVTIDLEETHYAYDTVTISPTKLECEEYQFQGWEEVEEVEKINDETFIMPTNNVTIRGKWTKLELNKTMEGTVYEKLTLYKAVANQAVLDNIKSKYVSRDNGIVFNAISSDTNGKGVYTIATTANDEYPIHYYRGDVDNNHVIFAGYCWEIVRTTETGGVKLIYDGEPSDGTCPNTGEASQLSTKTQFNSNLTSPAYIGYMYNSVYNVDGVYLVSQKGIAELNKKIANTNYYYSETITYDTTTKKYILDNPLQYVWESNYGTLEGYYTCFSETETSCSKMYYIAQSASSTVYYFTLSSGYLLEDVNTNLTFSSSVTKNEDGTYTLDNPETIKKSDWFDNYTKYVKYYQCEDEVSTVCSDVRNIASTDTTYYTYHLSDNEYVYGNSFTYDEDTNTYTLKDTISFWDYATNKSKIKNYHYTCRNISGTCESLYYIFYAPLTGMNFISLIDGKSIEDVLNELLSVEDVNKTNSTIKTVIDEWYEENMLDYTKYLEDTIWCNDRSISSLGGWNPIGGTVESVLGFSGNKRLYGVGRTSLSCSNIIDSFTLKIENGGTEGYGNNTLDYSVGIITTDEIRYAGSVVKYGATSGSDFYLNTGQIYWTMTPMNLNYAGKPGYGVLQKDGLINVVNSGNYGVRPSISLKAEMEYIDGIGTEEDPYIIDEEI